MVLLAFATTLGGSGRLAGQAARETRVTFQSGGVELTGTLRLPAAGEAASGVVFLPGGGRQFLTEEPTWFAEQFADRGIASLVFDKRGTGDSGGAWNTATFDDFLADAGVAVATLRSHLAPTAKIGVMGFSQGGRLAPVVAVRTGADAAVSISGPQTSVTRTRLFALEGAMRESGLREDDIALSLEIWAAHMELLRTGEGLAGLDLRVREARGRLHPSALPPLSGEYEPSPVFNSLHFSGEEALADLSVPWLAIFGADDRTVPVDESVQAIVRAMARSGNTEFSLIVVPESGHGVNGADGRRHPLYSGPALDWMSAQLARR